MTPSCLSDYERHLTEKRELWRKFFDAGVPFSIDYPEHPLKYYFRKWADRHPDKPYIIFNGRTITYRESNLSACRLANAMLRMGCEKGDRINVYLPNTPEYVITFQACFKIGAIIVNSNYMDTPREITATLNDTHARLVIFPDTQADKFIPLVESGNTRVKNMIVVPTSPGGMDIRKNKNLYYWSEIVNKEQDQEPDIEVHPLDIQVLQYTGGTTGVMKGCCHTNAGLLSHVFANAAWFTPAVSPEETRVLIGLPLSHGYAVNFGINLTLAGGGTIILVEKPTVANFIDAIRLYQPNVLPLVPALINGILHAPHINPDDFQCLRLIGCGASPLAQQTMLDFEKLTGAYITEAYGMSETINVISANPLKGIRKIGSVGIPYPDTDVLIVDLENGTQVLSAGERGEIIVRGPQVIKQYWRNSAETAHALRDGWLFTGDIGYMDEDGYLFIVDRKKDMIISSGFNVYPREIEEVLFQNPKINEACAIGISSDKKRGEGIKVFIVLNPHMEMTAQEVKNYCRQYLSPYKIPETVEFVDVIPKTKANKPDRKILKSIG